MVVDSEILVLSQVADDVVGCEVRGRAARTAVVVLRVAALGLLLRGAALLQRPSYT